MINIPFCVLSVERWNEMKGIKFFGIFLVMMSYGCSLMISSATTNLTTHLSHAILDCNDLKTIEDAAPAYLVMIDSFIRREPNNKNLLISGATLYSAYSSIFVTDKERSQKLTNKSLDYAFRAMNLSGIGDSSLRQLPFQDFSKRIDRIGLSDIQTLFTLGTSWAAWIAAYRDDWNAIADISKVELIMKKVTQLDPTWENGVPFMYLGSLATLIPPSLGGKPDIGKEYFEKAIELSQGKNLMAKVWYAQQYARLIFDRALHDRLLNEVLNSTSEVPGYTLMNTLAKKQATELLKNADDYF